MLPRIRPRLTYANVMSSIAVFVVLGGGAYATIDRKIRTADLQNRAVSTKKVKKQAIRPALIAAEAVRTAKIAEGAVNTSRLSDDAVSTDKLSDGAVSTDKLGEAAVSNSNLANPLYSAVVQANGNLVRTVGASSSQRLAQGLYEVRFDRDLSDCSWIGQIGSPDGNPVASGEVSTSLRSPNDSEALLLIVNGSNGVVADRPFHVFVQC
jgi:hypothetical protein